MTMDKKPERRDQKLDRSKAGLMSRWLPLEKPLLEIEDKIAELERLTATTRIDKSAEIKQLRDNHQRLLRQIFSRLSPWDQALMARHPMRPYTLDYIGLIVDDFVELHGDRRFGDDAAIVAGFGRLGTQPVAVIGHQKGRDTRDRQFRNYGMAHPEGYRKALRVMKLAEKFRRPVISFIDTPAAECREGAEERGISEAIARNMAEMSRLRTPVLVAVIGEGGSGGAIGIGVGNWIMMLEHAIYSVIPPEGCAAILDTFGRDAGRASEAAAALRISAEQTLSLGIIDQIVPEPLGGAHRDVAAAAAALKQALTGKLPEFLAMSTTDLVDHRYRKFRAMGRFVEPPAAPATGA
jgi:acetyl-CoA carboxylase carboxyl transferase subunit alpha